MDINYKGVSFQIHLVNNHALLFYKQSHFVSFAGQLYKQDFFNPMDLARFFQFLKNDINFRFCYSKGI